MSDPGFSRVTSRVLAGPRDGCNRLIVRYLSIAPGGHTSRESVGLERVHFVVSGHGEFVDPDGFAHEVSPGDVIIVQAWELHHFQNRTAESLGVILLSGQGR